MNRYLFYCSVLSVLLVTLMVSGCRCDPTAKMYPGEEVASDKRAVIKGAFWGHPLNTMNILSVDGKSTTDFLGLMTHRGVSAVEVYVLPGKHDIVVEVRKDSRYVTADLCLVAEAGERYIIKYITKGYDAIIWIENERTCQPVPKCESDDKPKQN